MGKKTLDELVTAYNKNNKAQYGLISLDHILYRSSKEDLLEFVKKHEISLSESDLESKNSIILKILDFFLSKFSTDDDLKTKFCDPIDYLGKIIYDDLYLENCSMDFDFISKTELINIFAEYCADLGINVYRCDHINGYDLDLYLTKKPKGIFTTTESVIVRTGFELNKDNYDEMIGNLARSTLIAEWKLFVTTPIGAKNIGLERLIADMKRINTWLYIIDPVQQRVLGVTKGKNSKARDSELRDRLISSLPQRPIRAGSQVIKISKYAFDERSAYKPKKIRMNYIDPIVSRHDHWSTQKKEKKYKNNFQMLLIMGRESGINIFSYSDSANETNINEQMISGFLTAIDSFVQTLSGSTGLQEISYKGFKICAEIGENIKIITILSESSDDIFRERLKYLVKQIESRFENQIKISLDTGEKILENNEDINKRLNSLIIQILDI